MKALKEDRKCCLPGFVRSVQSQAANMLGFRGSHPQHWLSAWERKTQHYIPSSMTLNKTKHKLAPCCSDSPPTLGGLHASLGPGWLQPGDQVGSLLSRIECVPQTPHPHSCDLHQRENVKEFSSSRSHFVGLLMHCRKKKKALHFYPP